MRFDIKDTKIKDYLIILLNMEDYNEGKNNFLAKQYIKNKNNKEKKELEKTLIEGNLKKVLNIAIKYRTPRLNISELIKEGNKGLIDGVKSWTPDKNENFTDYIICKIEDYVLNYVIKKEREFEKNM